MYDLSVSNDYLGLEFCELVRGAGFLNHALQRHAWDGGLTGAAYPAVH